MQKYSFSRNNNVVTYNNKIPLLVKLIVTV